MITINDLFLGKQWLDGTNLKRKQQTWVSQVGRDAPVFASISHPYKQAGNKMRNSNIYPFNRKNIDKSVKPITRKE
jgi:hypothetical protein